MSLALMKFGNDRIGEQEGSEEIEFSGRTPSVLITREILYRLCEMSSNQNFSKDETMAIFNGTLATIKEVWALEASNTTVSVNDNLTITESQEISESLGINSQE